jgi:hypothetical protein
MCLCGVIMGVLCLKRTGGHHSPGGEHPAEGRETSTASPAGWGRAGHAANKTAACHTVWDVLSLPLVLAVFPSVG